MDTEEITLHYEFIEVLGNGNEEVMLVDIKENDLIKLLLNSPEANVVLSIRKPKKPPAGYHFKTAS